MKLLHLPQYPSSLNSYQIRVGAGIISFISGLSIIFGMVIHPYIFLGCVLFLLVDFFLGFVLGPEYSIFKYPIKTIYYRFLNKEKWVSSRPKRFARLCGMIFILLSLALYPVSIWYAIIPMVLLAFFSFLEAVFDFCVACKMYGLAQKWGIIPKTYCEDC